MHAIVRSAFAMALVLSCGAPRAASAPPKPARTASVEGDVERFAAVIGVGFVVSLSGDQAAYVMDEALAIKSGIVSDAGNGLLMVKAAPLHKRVRIAYEKAKNARTGKEYLSIVRLDVLGESKAKDQPADPRLDPAQWSMGFAPSGCYWVCSAAGGCRSEYDTGLFTSGTQLMAGPPNAFKEEAGWKRECRPLPAPAATPAPAPPASPSAATPPPAGQSR